MEQMAESLMAVESLTTVECLFYCSVEQFRVLAQGWVLRSTRKSGISSRSNEYYDTGEQT